MRFSIHSSSFRPPPSFNGYDTAQDNDLPLHPHTSPPFIPIPNPPQAQLKLHPYAPQIIAPFSLPALRVNLGYVYTLPVRGPQPLGRRLVKRVPRPRQTYVRAPSFWASVSGSRMHSKKARLSIKTRRLFCDSPPYGSIHSGQGDVVGEFVQVLVEGGGWWNSPGLCGPPRPAGLRTCPCRPRVEYGTSTGSDLPRGSSHLTE